VAVVEEVRADEVEVLPQQGHRRAAESSGETREGVRRRPEKERPAGTACGGAAAGAAVRAPSEWCTDWYAAVVRGRTHGLYSE